VKGCGKISKQRHDTPRTDNVATTSANISQVDYSLRLNELIKPVDCLQESRLGCEPDFGVLQISLERETMINIAIKADLVRDSHILENSFGLVTFRRWEQAVGFCVYC